MLFLIEITYGKDEQFIWFRGHFEKAAFSK